ncbi:helix-turn-helix domain-containing protein [Gordonia desulfuricans]|uniref:helix-turn-helix domain-containing protein n=1 Tax=Gordonia desulfuricans TaxID=89051 RepID=UPI00073F8C13|nr:helix-turn-helix domain-containing protein [Gordonia desulfuricans]
MAADAPEGRGQGAIIGGGTRLPLRVGRHAPPQALAHWVDYLWIVRWSVREPHVQQVIPQPVIHVAAEDGRLSVHGVGDNSFARTLLGDGHVVGIAFRAGGFRGFADGPVSALSRSVRPLQEVLGVDDRPIAADLLDPDPDDAELTRRATEWLIGLGPTADPMIDRIAAFVDIAEGDATITRAEQLAEIAGVSLRTLQRQFGDYVGIGPKWVIQRFRVLDVAAVANRGGEVDWADTAVRLGFSDQSHLIRAFTRIVGTPPASYARGDLPSARTDTDSR